MSKRIFELFLFDILVAISKIEKVSEDFSNSEDLKHNFMAWDSVIREFEIVGEATNRLINANILSEENRVVVDFRNLLIHHYFGIDADEVWNVIDNDIKEYKSLIETVIMTIDSVLKTELIDEIIEENKHLNFIVKELEELR